MKISTIVNNYSECRQFESMLEGLSLMLRDAKDSSKKEMLKDVIKYGTKISKNYRSHLNSNEYLQVENFGLEILLKKEQHDREFAEIMLERFKKGI